MGKLLSKQELLFLDHSNYSFVPSQVLILKFPITTASLPPSTSPSSTQSYFFLLHSATSHHKYWTYQNIRKAKPSKFIIKLYTDHNTLWMKHATYHKTESLTAASLSKFDNMVNNNSVFNTKYAEFSTK